jgi:hypothetical protein
MPGVPDPHVAIPVTIRPKKGPIAATSEKYEDV